MNLVPWKNKQRESDSGQIMPMVALRSEMDRLFDSFFHEPFGGMDWSPWGSDKWSPAMDVAENDTELTVRAELPGIDPKELDISVSGHQLTIGGEKRESSETQQKQFHRSETRYGSFRRTIALPEGVDTENIDAQYVNGVLTLRLKKTAPAATKRIEVKVK
jgi:HSP20 family protein